MAFRLLKRTENAPEVASEELPKSISGSSSKILGQIEEVGVGFFWASDQSGNLIYLSQQAQESLGDGAESLIGQPLTSAFISTSVDGQSSSARSLNLKIRSQSKIDDLIVEIALSKSSEDGDPELNWWRTSARPYFNAAKEFCGYRGVAADITRDFRHQQSVARHSQYDELTGLANRRRITSQLEKTLNSFKSTGRSCALMMLDLDRFKQVNDTMGHPAGDELLKQVAERLNTIV